MACRWTPAARNLLLAARLTISINGCAGGGGTEGLNRAIKREVADADRGVAAFYRTQGFRPIWIRAGALTPQATEAARLLASARDDGLEPARYRVNGLPGANAGASDLAEAEVRLSATVARYAEDLHRPPGAMVFTDPDARPPAITEADILSGLARAPDPHAYLLNIRRMNPLYESLRDGFRRYRAEWMTLPDVSVATGPTLSEGMGGERVAALRKRLGFPAPGGFDADVARKLRSFQLIHGLPANGRADSATVAALNRGPSGYEQVIRANLDRLRGLPANLSPRAIVVDTRSAELTYFDGAKPAGTMRVIVGRIDQQTPTMAGMLRFAVLRPYWNVPPDIVRNRFAPDVLREGDGVLDEHQMEVLADWSKGHRPSIRSRSIGRALQRATRCCGCANSPARKT